MSEHTPGRLHTHDNHLHLARERDGEVQLHYCLAVGTVSGTIGVAQASADMAHLAACWNACEGINPETVPGLLEAYKAAMASQLEERENKSMMCLTCGHAWVSGDEHHADGCWVGTARAAIAKAQT